MAKHEINEALMDAYRSGAFEVDHPDGTFVIRVGESRKGRSRIGTDKSGRQFRFNGNPPSYGVCEGRDGHCILNQDIAM